MILKKYPVCDFQFVLKTYFMSREQCYLRLKAGPEVISDRINGGIPREYPNKIIGFRLELNDFALGVTTFHEMSSRTHHSNF